MIIRSASVAVIVIIQLLAVVDPDAALVAVNSSESLLDERLAAVVDEEELPTMSPETFRQQQQQPLQYPDTRYQIAKPSETNLQERFGDHMPNVSPFIFNCDTDSDVPWFHPLLGTFSRDPIKYCSSNCLRNLVCCRPNLIHNLDVKFIFSNQEEQTVIGRFDDPGFRRYLTRPHHQDGRRRIAFISHGFANDFRQFTPINETREGFLALGFDVMLIDWHFADAVYGQAIYNMRVVGAMVGYLIDAHDLQDVTLCVGFSLGAHLCGEAGKWLKQRSSKMIAECHMLDPAGPGFDGCTDDLRGNKNDCSLVLSVHTSQNTSVINPFSILLTQGYGTKYKTGHCDFWVNDALMWRHPDCYSPRPNIYNNYFNTSKLINYSFQSSCSHHRALDVYNSQLRGGCLFMGIESTNCGHVRECKPVEGTALVPMPPLTRHLCDSSMDKDFRVLAKSGRYPFCKE